jgi:hypothetical protein
MSNRHPVGETFDVPRAEGPYEVGSTSGTYTMDPTHTHGTSTTVGYRVVRTDWTEGLDKLRATVLADVDGAGRYEVALAHARVARLTMSPNDPQAVVIETVYACGCSAW